MNISVSPEIEQQIKDHINSGQFTSIEEVVQEGLRVFFELEQYNAWKKSAQEKVEAGLDDLERNGGIPVNVLRWN